MADRRVAYLDASAFVKLVKDEPESADLNSALEAWPRKSSSALLEVEGPRAARRTNPLAYEAARALLAGMELLDRGKFTYNMMHPPLSRAPIALGPYLDGARSAGKTDPVAEGNESKVCVGGRDTASLPPFRWLVPEHPSPSPRPAGG